MMTPDLVTPAPKGIDLLDWALIEQHRVQPHDEDEGECAHAETLVLYAVSHAPGAIAGLVARGHSPSATSPPHPLSGEVFDSPVLRACTQPNAVMLLQALVDAGATLHETTWHGNSLFHHSLAQIRDKDQIAALFDFLMAQGADCHLENDAGLNAVGALLVDYHHPVIAERMMDMGAPALGTTALGRFKVLNYACGGHGRLSEEMGLRVLSEATTAELLAPPPTGENPLVFRAMGWGRLEIVQMLFDQGVSPFVTDSFGESLAVQAMASWCGRGDKKGVVDDSIFEQALALLTEYGWTAADFAPVLALPRSRLSHEDRIERFEAFHDALVATELQQALGTTLPKAEDKPASRGPRL
jgi:hypothetical protein